MYTCMCIYTYIYIYILYTYIYIYVCTIRGRIFGVDFFVHALPILAPNLGEGIPLPIFQLWCGEWIPLPNFLKSHLVRGVHPKLVRGARSKMRSSNVEIVWQRARTVRRCSATPLKGVYFAVVSSWTHPKMSLHAHPGLSYIATDHRLPRPLKRDTSRVMDARRVASQVYQDNQRWLFSVSRVWCVARNLLALDLHTLAHFATAPHSLRWSRPGDLHPHRCGPTRETDVSPHTILYLFVLNTPGTRDSGVSLAITNLEQDYLTRKTVRMWPLWISW